SSSQSARSLFIGTFTVSLRGGSSRFSASGRHQVVNWDGPNRGAVRGEDGQRVAVDLEAEGEGGRAVDEPKADSLALLHPDSGQRTFRVAGGPPLAVDEPRLEGQVADVLHALFVLLLFLHPGHVHALLVEEPGQQDFAGLEEPVVKEQDLFA